jgi:tetratricopeptide (TPR) repeat protein
MTRGRTDAWIAGALAAAVCLAFLPVAGNGFLSYDDDRFLTANAAVHGGLTPAGLRWAFTSLDELNWHPVAWIAYMADWTLFGPRAGAHHLASVFWHALAAVLLFLALRRMTGRLWPAAFAAALFALHPLRVESVAWAAELKDPLSGCFFGLTLLAYAAHARRPGAARHGALLAAFALGLMAKPSLVPLPFLLLLLDYWPLGRREARVLAEKLPLLAMSAVAGAITYRAQVLGGTAGISFTALPLGARVANAVVSSARYLGKLLWPAKLAVFYPHPGTGLPAATVAAAAAVLLGLAVLALARLRRQPYLAVGLGWYLGMLAPTAGIVQASIQGMADRFTYLPLTGIGVALAWAAADAVALRRLPPGLRVAGAALPLAALAAATWTTAGYWRSDRTLFEHALAVTERNPIALGFVGVAREEEGRLDEALALYRQAAELMPGNSLAHYRLGNAYRKKGQLAEAIASYRTAIRTSRGGVSPELYNNLGGALAQAGSLGEAEELFRRALRIDPGFTDAASNLRWVQGAQSRR